MNLTAHRPGHRPSLQVKSSSSSCQEHPLVSKDIGAEVT